MALISKFYIRISICISLLIWFFLLYTFNNIPSTHEHDIITDRKIRRLMTNTQKRVDELTTQLKQTEKLFKAAIETVNTGKQQLNSREKEISELQTKKKIIETEVSLSANTNNFDSEIEATDKIKNINNQISALKQQVYDQASQLAKDELLQTRLKYQLMDEKDELSTLNELLKVEKVESKILPGTTTIATVPENAPVSKTEVEQQHTTLTEPKSEHEHQDTAQHTNENTTTKTRNVKDKCDFVNSNECIFNGEIDFTKSVEEYVNVIEHVNEYDGMKFEIFETNVATDKCIVQVGIGYDLMCELNAEISDGIWIPFGLCTTEYVDNKNDLATCSNCNGEIIGLSELAKTKGEQFVEPQKFCIIFNQYETDETKEGYLCKFTYNIKIQGFKRSNEKFERISCANKPTLENSLALKNANVDTTDVAAVDTQTIGDGQTTIASESENKVDSETTEIKDIGETKEGGTKEDTETKEGETSDNNEIKDNNEIENDTETKDENKIENDNETENVSEPSKISNEKKDLIYEGFGNTFYVGIFPYIVTFVCILASFLSYFMLYLN